MREQTASDRINRSELATLLPPVDVYEDASGITLYADLPGVAKEGLNLQVEGESLSIDAEITLALPPDTQSSHAEVKLPRYRRVFTLSKELDAERISAELRHGVLTLRIPKAAHARPRRIEVEG
jgi:HSP20 family protein